MCIFMYLHICSIKLLQEPEDVAPFLSNPHQDCPVCMCVCVFQYKFPKEGGKEVQYK